MLKKFFVIGMDGGGTATDVILADLQGHIINQFQLGSLNINGQSQDFTERTLSDVLNVVHKENLDIKNCRGICVGAAGISNSNTTTVISQFFQHAGLTAPIRIVGDHETALAGATGEVTGVILIAGTGSICFGISQTGERYRAGGYGHIIDDAGSGYYIGKSILASVVQAVDGRGVQTVLKEKVFSRLQIQTTEELIGWLYHPDTTKRDIAALAILLEESFHEGDQVAYEILKECVVELIKLAKAVLKQMECVKSLVVSGSILMKNETIYSRFCDGMKKEYPELNILKMRGSAAEGAVRIMLKEMEHGKVFDD